MAAIPNDLIESELFGHEKGSFTGAHQKSDGKFKLAEKGTGGTRQANAAAFERARRRSDQGQIFSGFVIQGNRRQTRHPRLKDSYPQPSPRLYQR